MAWRLIISFLSLLCRLWYLVGNAEVTKNILKLSERMVMSFCSGVSGSLIHQWTEVTGAATNEVMIRSRKNNGDPGRPAGTALGASTSIWLPIAPKTVFDFLRNVPTRNQARSIFTYLIGFAQI